MIKSKSIVLHRYPYSDSSWIVKALTEECGIVSFIVKGGKRKESPFRGALDPLALAEVVFKHNPNAELQFVKEATLLRWHESMRGDLLHLAQAQVMAEMILRYAPQGVPLDEEFQHLEGALAELDSKDLADGAFARWLLATCAGYCIADWYIVRTFDAVAPAFPDLFGRSLFALALIYVVTGAASVALLPLSPRFPAADWRRHALPYAVLWFGAMIVLYVCFAACGLVLGNIVQSTRGLISVALGWFVARAGRTDLEERVGLAVLARRVFAALLLVAAVALYAAG